MTGSIGILLHSASTQRIPAHSMNTRFRFYKIAGEFIRTQHAFTQLGNDPPQSNGTATGTCARHRRASTGPQVKPWHSDGECWGCHGKSAAKRQNHAHSARTPTCMDQISPRSIDVHRAAIAGNWLASVTLAQGPIHQSPPAHAPVRMCSLQEISPKKPRPKAIFLEDVSKRSFAQEPVRNIACWTALQKELPMNSSFWRAIQSSLKRAIPKELFLKSCSKRALFKQLLRKSYFSTAVSKQLLRNSSF